MNNREKEEKLLAYQNMLNNGQIDRTTYDNMVERNIGLEYANSYKPRRNKSTIIVVFLICLLLFGLYRLINVQKDIPPVNKEYETVSNYNKIDPPIQNDYRGSTSIMVGNTPVQVNYVAYYEVSGKVVEKVNYYSDSVSNMASQYDVALVWGKLATDEYLEKIDFSAPGNRFVYWKTNDMNWYRLHTNDREIKEMYSNNHLVTTNNEIIGEIKNIKKGDYVRIKGYLANLSWTENNSSHTWKSSTRRDDDGDGACEIIYVTDVKWLQVG